MPFKALADPLSPSCLYGNTYLTFSNEPSFCVSLVSDPCGAHSHPATYMVITVSCAASAPHLGCSLESLWGSYSFHGHRTPSLCDLSSQSLPTSKVSSSIHSIKQSKSKPLSPLIAYVFHLCPTLLTLPYLLTPFNQTTI